MTDASAGAVGLESVADEVSVAAGAVDSVPRVELAAAAALVGSLVTSLEGAVELASDEGAKEPGAEVAEAGVFSALGAGASPEVVGAGVEAASGAAADWAWLAESASSAKLEGADASGLGATAFVSGSGAAAPLGVTSLPGSVVGRVVGSAAVLSAGVVESVGVGSAMVVAPI